MRTLRLLFVASMVSLFAATASAIPALQLGPGDPISDWSYDTTTDTWVTTSSTFELLATANSDGVDAHGDYAWDPAGADDQKAYLVVASHPESLTSTFNITIENDGGMLVFVDSGYGAPPLSDPNKLMPHGIFDTYYELYEFNFEVADGTTTIFDSQPGMFGMGEGFEEIFNITIGPGTTGGVHFDLFTLTDDGMLDVIADNDMVKSFAPPSHDAEMMIPEPTAALVFGMGLLVVGIRIRRP